MADSRNVVRRRFCPKCGTLLFCEVIGEPNLMVVRCGALEDPEIGQPESVIWTASAAELGVH